MSEIAPPHQTPHPTRAAIAPSAGVPASAPEAPCQQPIQIRGGGQAPGLARSHVLARLRGRASLDRALDAALIASELVTNSVLHAAVGHDGELTLELATLGGRIRVAVTDAGSDYEPRMLPAIRTSPGASTCAWSMRCRRPGALSVTLPGVRACGASFR